MKKEIRDILETPFAPEQIKQREGIYGQMLDYVEGWAVIERLNQAFDGDWTFEITHHEILDDEVVVLGKFRSDGIVKSQFGSSEITRSEETGKPVSIGDDLKAAATDALKKCASLLGVALHLYNGDNRTVRKESEQSEQVTSEKSPAAEDGRSNGGNGQNSQDTRLTSKQLNYLNRIARNQRMTKKELANRSKEVYGVQPEYLTKKQASELIDELLTG